MPAFFKTHRDGERWIHIAHSAGQDTALCGEDVLGDESPDDKLPESLGEKRGQRVTCPHCLAIIDTCRNYLRHNNRGVPCDGQRPSVGDPRDNP